LPIKKRRREKTVVIHSAKRSQAQGSASLSPREREIVKWLAHGLSNKEIGARLSISPFTARNHLARIFEKLRVRSRTEAVIAYLRMSSKISAIIFV